jgi:PEP-CTERM motif
MRQISVRRGAWGVVASVAAAVLLAAAGRAPAALTIEPGVLFTHSQDNLYSIRGLAVDKADDGMGHALPAGDFAYYGHIKLDDADSLTHLVRLATVKRPAAGDPFPGTFTFMNEVALPTPASGEQQPKAVETDERGYVFASGVGGAGATPGFYTFQSDLSNLGGAATPAFFEVTGFNEVGGLAFELSPGGDHYLWVSKRSYGAGEDSEVRRYNINDPANPVLDTTVTLPVSGASLRGVTVDPFTGIAYVADFAHPGADSGGVWRIDLAGNTNTFFDFATLASPNDLAHALDLVVSPNDGRLYVSTQQDQGGGTGDSAIAQLDADTLALLQKFELSQNGQVSEYGLGGLDVLDATFNDFILANEDATANPTFDDTILNAHTPEPGTLAVFAAGGVVVLMRRRRG